MGGGVVATLSCLRCKARRKEVASTGNSMWGKDTITLAVIGDGWRQGDHARGSLSSQGGRMLAGWK